MFLKREKAEEEENLDNFYLKFKKKIRALP